MWNRVLDETCDDELMYMFGCVEVLLIALVMFEFDPAPINNPPLMLKLPLKSAASSTPLEGPLAMVIPPEM